MTAVQSPEEPIGGPRMFSAAEFAGRAIKPRPMLVPGFIPGNQVASIDGDGGAGKSTIGIQLCASAASGQPWLGQTVKRGPAIYLASEDDKDEIQCRLEEICVDLKIGLHNVADMKIWPLATEDPALFIPGHNDTLQPTARWAQLQAHVDRVKPVVLVLDSRADVARRGARRAGRAGWRLVDVALNGRPRLGQDARRRGVGARADRGRVQAHRAGGRDRCRRARRDD